MGTAVEGVLFFRLPRCAVFVAALTMFQTCPRVCLPVSSLHYPRPDLVCYNCAVKACGTSGEFARALEVMDVSFFQQNLRHWGVWSMRCVRYECKVHQIDVACAR